MRHKLGRGPLLASVAATLLAGCATATTTAPKSSNARLLEVTSTSTTPHVIDGRFTASYELDGGGLLVNPVSASYVAQRNLASVRTQAWATSQVSPLAPYVVGLGKVTITRHDRGVQQVRNLVAWVALAKSSEVSSCTAFTPPPPKVQPPSDGWSAVVIGDATGSPAVVYQSASIFCNRLGHTVVEPATEVISTPWTLTSGGVIATAPSCSTFAEVGSGSTPTGTSFYYLVTIPEARASAAVPGARAMPRCMPAGTTRSVDLSGNSETRGVVPTTLHEPPTGLLRQVSTVPYQGPPTTSTSVSTLAKYAHWAPPPGPGVLGYLPSSNGRVATIFSWSGRRLGRFHAGVGEQILESDSASALAPSGRSILAQRGFTVSAMTISRRLIGHFNANDGVLWGNDSVHVCALRLPAHVSTGSTKATLVLEHPGHASRVVAEVPGTGDHINTWLVACDPARHVAAVETSLMGSGVSVTYVNLKTGAQSPAPWYDSKMGTVEISGDGRFAVADGGQVVETSNGKIVARVARQPIAISWLGHVVVVMAGDDRDPEVVNWVTHRIVWRFRSHVGACPCGSIWATAANRMNSDDLAVTRLRADRPVGLWFIRFRGSAQSMGSAALLHP
jgi:hypothetical protein